MTPAVDDSGTDPGDVHPEHSAARPRHPAWDLLWTVPVALVVSVLPLAWAGLTWCGVWGCPNGSRRDVLGVIPPSVVVGALVGAAVVVVPWTEHRVRRALVSAGVGLVAAVLAFLWVVLD